VKERVMQKQTQEALRRAWRRYDIHSLDNRDPQAIAGFSRWIYPLLKAYFRAEIVGLEHIVAGPALYTGNHSSGLLTPDTFLLLGALYQAQGLEAVPYGLGHQLAIQMPLAHQIVMPLGALCANHENAHRVFSRGNKLLVYPGGDFDAFRPYKKRNRIMFGGRRGYIRLALREGVPLCPVVTAGAHGTSIVLMDLQPLIQRLGLAKLLRAKSWPLTWSVPWGLTPWPPFPYWPLPVRITMALLPPIYFPRSGEQSATDEGYVSECASHVETLMQQALDRLLEARRRPLHAF
jgi:1-acyl-sn-glycerol-3-phosphate acyltransferase